MTLARLRKIWYRHPFPAWLNRMAPMYLRTGGDTRSKHGRMARARKAWLKSEDATHRRVRESIERMPCDSTN